MRGGEGQRTREPFAAYPPAEDLCQMVVFQG